MKISLQYSKIIKSKKTLKTRQKFDFGMEQKKKQHFFPHASRFSISIWFVAAAFRSDVEFFLIRGPLVTNFCPALDPPLGRYGRNTLMHVRGHEHFIPTTFHQNPSSGSVVKADYVSLYTYMN